MPDEDLFDPPAPTPGAVHCGGHHLATARHELDGSITWVCVRCLKERVITDGQGWR